jgi:hypothetical protein
MIFKDRIKNRQRQDCKRVYLYRKYVSNTLYYLSYCNWSSWYSEFSVSMQTQEEELDMLPVKLGQLINF